MEISKKQETTGRTKMAKYPARKSGQRSLRFEALESRTMLTANVLNADAFAAVRNEASEWMPAAVSQTDLAQVRGRLAENIPPSCEAPTNRGEVTSAQPGDQFLLEVLLQDIRPDDGVGGNSQFGVYASYLNIGFDAEAFVIPPGSANIPQGFPQQPFPISFQNAYYGVPIDTGSFLGDRPDEEVYRYVNGPMGDLETPGLVNNVGSFLDSLSPPGRSELFQFDIPFVVQSLVARDATAQVSQNGSVRIPVLENDTLISGNYTFELGPPSSLAIYDFLLFGETGQGSVVPPEKINFVSPKLNVENDGTLQIAAVTQGQKGSVTVNEDGTVTYTPHVSSAGMDSFTYTVTDGNGNSETATVEVEIQASGRADIAGRLDTGHWVVGVNTGNSFQSDAWGFWGDGVWENIVVGDFNGDGRADIAGRMNNRWYVGLNSGNSFVTTYWGLWGAGNWTDVMVGDFTGNGKDDIAARLDNRWYIATSTGTSFTTSYWGLWGSGDWTDVMVGDFNGNGRSDIAGRLDNRWYVATSLGTSIHTTYWGIWGAGNWTDVMVGDFNGNGRDDIVGRLNGTRWYVASNMGTSFKTSFWGQWGNGAWTDVMVADFSGNGIADIAGRLNNRWYVASSTGDSFLTSSWGIWGAMEWHNVQVGDFDGDGRSDIVGRLGDGRWWVARSKGSSFQTDYWGRWDPSLTWLDVLVDDFVS